jgi:glycosyltransferase involved in cell wall biosynthesis
LKPRVLFLVPADYDALCAKGTVHILRERDEHGYFERVITVHPLSRHRRVIDVDSVHRVYEFPLAAALDGGWVGCLRAPLLLLTIALEILRLARAERVDLVRANDPYLMGFLGLLVARRLRLPFCISLHADYRMAFELTPKRGLGRALRAVAGVFPRRVVPRADLLLPISRYLAGIFESMGAAPSAIRVIPHGIDTGRFSGPALIDVRARFEIPRDAPVISWVSRMSGENYSVDIPEIVERVLRVHPHVVFVLAGDGAYRSLIETRLRACEAAVRILPFQPREIVAAIRQVSSAAVCLIGGFSLLEACAAGAPVVAYDVEWHAEVIEDGVTGFLVPQRDVDGVAAALTRLIDDPGRAAEMGREAQRRVRLQYDVSVTSAIKQRCYTELLGSSSARPTTPSTVAVG